MTVEVIPASPGELARAVENLRAWCASKTSVIYVGDVSLVLEALDSQSSLLPGHVTFVDRPE